MEKKSWNWQFLGFFLKPRELYASIHKACYVDRQTKVEKLVLDMYTFPVGKVYMSEAEGRNMTLPSSLTCLYQIP